MNKFGFGFGKKGDCPWCAGPACFVAVPSPVACRRSGSSPCRPLHCWGHASTAPPDTANVTAKTANAIRLAMGRSPATNAPEAPAQTPTVTEPPVGACPQYHVVQDGVNAASLDAVQTLADLRAALEEDAPSQGFMFLDAQSFPVPRKYEATKRPSDVATDCRIDMSSAKPPPPDSAAPREAGQARQGEAEAARAGGLEKGRAAAAGLPQVEKAALLGVEPPKVAAAAKTEGLKHVVALRKSEVLCCVMFGVGEVGFSTPGGGRINRAPPKLGGRGVREKGSFDRIINHFL